MLSNEYMEILKQKAQEVCGKMREIITGLSPIYDGYVIDNYFEIYNPYQDFRKCVDEWVTMAVSFCMIDSGKSSYFVTLRYEDGEQEFFSNSVIMGGLVKNFVNIGRNDHHDHSEHFYTPFGEMTYEFYQLITEIPENPVKLYYEWVDAQLSIERNLLRISKIGVSDIFKGKTKDIVMLMTMYADKLENVPYSKVIAPELLELAGIEDPLCLWKLDAVVSNVSEFFQSLDKGAVENELVGKGI